MYSFNTEECYFGLMPLAYQSQDKGGIMRFTLDSVNCTKFYPRPTGYIYKFDFTTDATLIFPFYT